MTGAIYARFELAGETFEVNLPAGGGKMSDSVATLKAESMKFLGDYLQRHNGKVEEVDMLEEEESEGEEAVSGKRGKGKKRKR
mmetsp:Transcript_44253/g.112966  ORF Transcript_44253/g.112966 Transcript_44253/m.112966 type:complete len:83 (+) Transcript_44253:231-479(+)|eukprot:jgi/Tetstr1/463236/TSEL_008167.t1